MVTSKRHRSKPALQRVSTGETTPEGGSYTVETRKQAAAEPPAGPADGIAGIIEALRGAGQVGIYRQNPTWARGHLQTLNLGAGESLDFQMLDELQRYWGGGVYSFRPMKRGRFAGSSQSVQFDGPTLYQGKPHPKDPDARAVTPEILPQPHYQPAAGYAPQYEQPGFGPPHPGAMGRPSPEMQMLGTIVERMMARLDSFEQKLAGPAAQPAQAPDQIAGVLSTLKLAKQINEMMNPAPYEDEENEEPEEWKPANPQEAMMQLAMKKFDEDPEAFSSIFGAKKAPPEKAGEGPRLVRAEQPAVPAAAPAPSPGTPAQILAQLKALDPAARAQLVNEIGQTLDAETLAALAELMGPDSAAG